VIEHRVDGRPAHLVVVHQIAARRDQRPRPVADLRVRSQAPPAGDLQHDAEHVLVDEEVAAGIVELQARQEGQQVEEERVAAEPGEEPEIVILAAGDERSLPEGHRRVLDDHLVTLAVARLPVRAHHRGELLAMALGRERDAVPDIRAGVPVGVDQHVIGGAMLELIGQRRRQRIDVQDENRLGRITGLLEDVDVGDVGPGVTIW